eukprot:gene19412-25287_t
MVNPQFISKLEGNLNDTLTPNLPSMGITTLKGIDKRELDSLITAEKNLAALNSKVDNKTQLLFDSFNKIYPCRWDGNIMIILDTFLIEPPYNSVKASPDQKSSTDEAGLKRIEMQDLLMFIEPYCFAITGLLLIRSTSDRRDCNSCVLSFRFEDDLESFLSIYNNLHYPIVSDTAPCLVAQVTNIFNRIETSSNNNLPTCSVCLRRLRSSRSGLNTSISSSLWTNCNAYMCAVCSAMSEYNGQLDNEENVWICMLCAHTGCGRYTSQHAKLHYELSGHCLSLELATARIWDYSRDTFVHIDYDSPHIIAVDSSVNDKPIAVDEDVSNKLKSLSEYYESLLMSQLRDQEIYYEKLLAKETVEALERGHRSDRSDSANSNAISSDELVTEEEMMLIESIKIDISELESEHESVLGDLRLADKSLRECRKINECVLRDQKTMKDKLEALLRQEKEMNERCVREAAELNQQINDLEFFNKSKDQLAEYKEEIEGSSIHIVPPITDNRNYRRTGRPNRNKDSKKKVSFDLAIEWRLYRLVISRRVARVQIIVNASGLCLVDPTGGLQNGDFKRKSDRRSVDRSGVNVLYG